MVDNILETDRLLIKKLDLEDAGFILELLNEPAFIQFIGDRGVRSLEDAKNYLLKGPLASYERLGFGLWKVELKPSGEAIGMCGLIKRDSLPDIDIGYAYLARFWSKGYASEAAQAVKDYSIHTLGLKRLLAITDQDNTGSIKVLEKIGMKFERLVSLEDENKMLNLFVLEG